MWMTEERPSRMNHIETVHDHAAGGRWPVVSGWTAVSTSDASVGSRQASAATPRMCDSGIALRQPRSPPRQGGSPPPRSNRQRPRANPIHTHASRTIASVMWLTERHRQMNHVETVKGMRRRVERSAACDGPRAIGHVRWATCDRPRAMGHVRSATCDRPRAMGGARWAARSATCHGRQRDGLRWAASDGLRWAARDGPRAMGGARWAARGRRWTLAAGSTLRLRRTAIERSSIALRAPRGAPRQRGSPPPRSNRQPLAPIPFTPCIAHIAAPVMWLTERRRMTTSRR
jgi:hypothetical protein